MANVLQIKKNAWNGGAGAPNANTIRYGELAWDNNANTLYIGKKTGVTGDGSNGGDATTAYKVLPDATSSVKGIASFSTNNFVVNSGVAQIKDLGIAREEIAADAINGSKIVDDAIDSEHIAADSIDTEHYAAGSVDSTALAANSVDSSELVDGSIDESHIANDAVTANKIVDNIALAGNCSSVGNFTVGGNLIVSGDTTTLNTATLSVEDLNITCASGAADSAAADGAGLTVAGASATILYEHTGTQWEFNKNLKIPGINDSVLDFGTYSN